VLPSPAETESPTPEFLLPDPKAEYSRSCDYVLGDFSENTSTGFRFIAGSDIDNTGNVGIEVELKATFKQLGSDPIVITKKGKVPWNESRSLNVTKPVSQDQIDLIQAAQDAGDICSVEVSINSTFGDPHSG
jgi:hypothetical protein